MSNFLREMQEIQDKNNNQFAICLTDKEIYEDQKKCEIWVNEAVEEIKRGIIQQAKRNNLKKGYNYYHKTFLGNKVEKYREKDFYRYLWSIPCVIRKDKRVCSFNKVSYYAYAYAEYPRDRFALECSDYKIYEYFLSRLVGQLAKEQIFWYQECVLHKAPSVVNETSLAHVKCLFDDPSEKKARNCHLGYTVTPNYEDRKPVVTYDMLFYYFP